MAMGVAAVMSVAVGMRISHAEMLYYNITGVYGRVGYEWLREADEQRGGRRE
jgi:hypothetical protein